MNIVIKNLFDCLHKTGNMKQNRTKLKSFIATFFWYYAGRKVLFANNENLNISRISIMENLTARRLRGLKKSKRTTPL